MSAAVALGGPVDACKHIFGADTTPPAPVYGGPPPTLAMPAYGVVPPVFLDAGAPALPTASDGGSDADAAHPDAGPHPHITMYGAPPHPRK